VQTLLDRGAIEVASSLSCSRRDQSLAPASTILCTFLRRECAQIVPEAPVCKPYKNKEPYFQLFNQNVHNWHSACSVAATPA
jgi:hypothetical protein